MRAAGRKEPHVTTTVTRGNIAAVHQSAGPNGQRTTGTTPSFFSIIPQKTEIINGGYCDNEKFNEV